VTPLAADIHHRLTLVAAQVDNLLGDDLIDRTLLADRLKSRADQYVARLGDDHPKLAAQTAIDLASLVDLDDPTDAASPLGIAVALTFEHEAIPQAAAAQLLGVSKVRVGQLLAAGKLTPVEHDGLRMVARASVARRLAGQAQP
jgi:predicted XRE-type DNA-binding protein